MLLDSYAKSCFAIRLVHQLSVTRVLLMTLALDENSEFNEILESSVLR